MAFQLNRITAGGEIGRETYVYVADSIIFVVVSLMFLERLPDVRQTFFIHSDSIVRNPDQYGILLILNRNYNMERTAGIRNRMNDGVFHKRLKYEFAD